MAANNRILRKGPLAAAALILSVFFVSGVLAHQQKTALTTVLFNPRTGNLEVVHQISVHDAEHAAKKLWGYADLTSAPERQKRFADYVRGRFTIKTSEDRALTLTPVGHEIEGPILWVYHETPAPTGAAELLVEDKILHDFWSDQVNLVNVEKGDFRGSLIFREASPPQSLVLEPAPEPGK